MALFSDALLYTNYLLALEFRSVSKLHLPEGAFLNCCRNTKEPVLFQLTKTKTKYIIVVRSTAKLKLNEMNHCSYEKN